jgi:uroporphyrinogen III methyltransferase/synthase
LFDRLASRELLRLTRPGCEKIDVGKGEGPSRKGTALRTRQQDRISRLLVQKARQHPIVVRLKGGDPMLFGRASEELSALVRAKIPFEIVPGVSSAWAAAAAAGIPLTDRRYSSSVAIVTGQQAIGSPKVKWEALAKGVDTIVILMGRTNLPSIVKRLTRAGRSGKTPIALIRWSSTPEEEILVSTLEKVEHDLKSRPHFGPPVVAVIGEVVERHKEFGPKPLAGKRILITRPASDGAGLNQRLKALGAKCLNLPTIAIRPRKISVKEGRLLLESIPGFDWIVFTSHHGVEALDRLSRRFKKGLPALVKGKVCAIGPRTSQAVREAGLRVDLLPKEFSTVGIGQAFRGIPLSRKRILIPRSNLAVRDSLSRMLRRQGATVEEVVMYETVKLAPSARRVREALRGLHVATFTSASTVQAFAQALRKAHLSPKSAFNGAAIVAIGPATGKALKESGITKFLLPKETGTVDGLIRAVTEAANA